VKSQLEAARAAAAKEDATKEEVAQAEEGLTAAVEALVRIQKEALLAKIAEAGKLKEGNYTSGSWARLALALGEAETVNANPSVEQADVDEAVENLDNAIQALVDVTALNDVLAEAAKIDKDNYTAESWEAFEAVWNRAQAVLDKGNASEKEIADAASGLRAAIQALTSSNKGELGSLVEEIEAKGYLASDYTKASWQAFQDALTAAKELGDVSQAEIDAAKDALLSAEAGLVSIKALKAKISEAEKIEADGYSGASWKSFQDALELAQAISSKEDATKAEVMAARTHLEASIDALYRPESLAALVEQAKDIKEDGYTKASWQVFQAALSDAQKALSSGTEEELRAAEKALQKALDSLAKLPDKSGLGAAIANAGTLKQEDYTEASWTALQTVLAQAKAVYQDKDSSEIDIKVAENDLNYAIRQLVPKPPKVDLDELNAIITEIERLDASSYTKVSWLEIQVALTNAKSIKSDNNATQEDINRAKADLWTAKDSLVDISGLQAAIAEAGKLDPAEYTDTTWTGYQAALASAVQTVGNDYATQEDVARALAEIQDAKASLAKRADTTELQQLIHMVYGLVFSDYTESTWVRLTAALAEAERMAANGDATQEQVDEARDALKAAKGALIQRADKTSLDERIAEVESVMRTEGEMEKYTTDTWNALEAAWNEAKAVSEDVNAASADVAAVLAKLDNAFGKLQVRGDKQSLRNLLELVKALDPADYTVESWAAVEEALKTAEAVATDRPDALQAEVNEAAEALKRAKDALVVVVYAVAFDTADGSQALTYVVTRGQQAVRPNDPVRAGYTFAGWFADGKAFDFATPITSDVVLTAKWNAMPSISKASVTVAKATYSGKALTPKVTVRLNGNTLKLNKDYTLKYSNNKKVGQGTVVVTGIGSYTGSKTVKFQIVPKKVKISKITNKKGKKVVVKFSKSAGAKGYEITYATNKNFKSAKKKTTTRTSITLSGLKKNKTYYVKVRAYTTIGGKRVYGLNSPKKKIKIKK
ncbi:InlB B-repeat-containing protein, partial [Lachnospiraceae bacterium 29-84]